MAKYTISIEVKAQRVPEQDPAPPTLGADPMANLAATASKMLAGGPFVVSMPNRPAGVEMSRNIIVTAESFSALAGILGKFDELAERLECENP